MNKVYIVLAVRNRLAFTKKCLKSLETQTYKNFEVVIVNHGSTDNTHKFIEKKYPKWKLITGQDSWWWTRAMYEGIEYSIKKSNKGDYILTINNDCTFDKNYIKNIVDTSNKNKRAITGSLVVDADNKSKVIEAGVKINWKESKIYGLSDTISDKLGYYKKVDKIKDIDTLPGKGALVPIEVFKKIGNFNYNRLPHYIADYEFFCRAKKRNFDLIVSTNSIVYNFTKETGTTHLQGSRSSYLKVINLLFNRKSKLNIIDYFNFILLCCPKKYLFINTIRIISRLFFYLLNLFPFYYISEVIKFFKTIFGLEKNAKQQIYKTSKSIKCKICGNSNFTLSYPNMYDNRHGYKGYFDILTCNSCSFMQTNPQLPVSKLTHLYSNYYPKRDSDIESIKKNSENIPSAKKILENGWQTTCHYKTRKGQKVLDIGCGTCQSLLEIKKMGGEPWGIEVDTNSQRVAKMLNLNFHLGTIHDCNFKQKYFDLITASQVLEHEPDPIEFLIKCKYFLKDNGKLIISVPNTGALSRLIWQTKWLHWHIPYHLNHFNIKSINALAERSGYTIETLQTATPNLWSILQIRTVINNVKMGRRDYMWDGKKQTDKKRESSLRLLDFSLTIAFKIIERSLFINRLIDKLKLGESIVVELSPNKP